MSAKSSSTPGDLPALLWVQPMPNLAHVPRTRLPEVKELGPLEGLRAWLAAGGGIYEGRLVS